VHPAIHEALRIIRSRPQFKISAKELADAVELSEGRLMDLFREHMGMPLRRFLMWQRVGEAAVRLAQGMPATEVAYEVGFADAAHLTRTLKRMLGIRPSDLLRFPPTRLHVCPPPG
jgi:AraC-like DNA-binding protein